MVIDTELQTRLQHMAAQDLYGQEALLLLQELVVFRAPFNREGLHAVMPASLSRFTGGAAFVVLCRWGWIIPTSTRHVYQVDPDLSAVLIPTQEAQRALFAYVILHSAYDHHTWHRAHWEDIDIALRWGLEHRRDDAHRFLRLLKRISVDANGPQFRTLLTYLITDQNDPFLKADLLCTAAIAAQQDGDRETMYEAYEAAIALYEQINNTKLQSLTLFRLGTHALEYGNLPHARDAFTRVLKIHFHPGALESLIEIAMKQEDWTNAYEYLIQIGTPAPTQGTPIVRTRNITAYLRDLRQAAGKSGRGNEAWPYFAQGYFLCAATAYEQQWLILWYWGELEIERGMTEQGFRLWQLALLAADALSQKEMVKTTIPWPTIEEHRHKLRDLEQSLMDQGIIRPDA